MNKTALKNFATNARNELIEKVKAKAFKIGVTEENIKKAQFESSDAIYIDGKQLSVTEKKQRERLISRIKEIGFKQVVEEVAYTWFNRFTALRFMEVNNYLPTKVRVLSSSNSDSSEPDIIKEALTVDLDIDKELVYELKLNNKTEKLYKYLVIKQCNSLNKVLPFMFETIDDYKEILFPDGLLLKDSFLRQMTDVTVIPESNWGQVEVIGWLYQFYIADEKDRVFKSKKKYSSDEIPFATQLFTPGWIVQYMVQNSLGRYWVESHNNDYDMVNEWKYYLQDRNSGKDFEERLTPFINNELKVEDIKCFDPAMGSGHILVYMFDLLYEIYRRCGYMDREIPRMILENNLYGLDIDDRACQLASFSLVMKAMQYNNRFFRTIEKDGLTLHLASIQETNSIYEKDIAYIAGGHSGVNFEKTKAFIDIFKDAKILGSLIKTSNYEKSFFKERIRQIQENPVNDIFMEESRVKAERLLPSLLSQAEIMSLNYDVVVTNPPYMGNRYMNDKLSTYLKKEYPDSKADTFASFMEINHYLKPNGFFAMINQHSWMFLSSYQRLREKIISQKTVYSMLHLGPRAFEEIGGEVVQSTAFVLRNFYEENFNGEYVRLVDFQDSKDKMVKTIEAVQNPDINYRYLAQSDEFTKIAGSPIAYWVSTRVKETFIKNKKMDGVASPRVGLQTGDNNKFLRAWTEIDFNNIGFDCNNSDEADTYKWIPYNKGGEFRKWFGNNYFVVNWENNGFEIKNYKDEMGTVKSVCRNTSFYFNEGITWSDISTSNFGVRYSRNGFIFDVSGSMAFPSKENLYYVTAFLCSKIAYEFLIILNPTMHFQTGNIANVPMIFTDNSILRNKIDLLSEMNINISKLDWDSYEMSWDFKMHPLLTFISGASLIKDSFIQWSEFAQEKFIQLKNNEEELNRLFIEIYGLQEEMTPDVDDVDVTVRIADQERDIKSFISYAVGCMFGRYSLDKDGLVFAGGMFESENYQTFPSDKDNILPIVSGVYFEDNISTKFMEFVKVTYGEDYLADNFEYIANTIGKKEGETAKEALTRYLRDDFFKDHLQTYKKKPIYWLFTSGKQKAFNCLIYMHRYDKSTLSRIRTDYLHELQFRMDAEKKTLLDVINGDGTTKEIANAKKELKSLDLKIEELRAYDEKLHHMADMQIEIDLDDGVAVNYAKFEGLLAPIK